MKIKFLLLFFLFFSLFSFGQDHKEKWDKIKALKVSFITTELNLTTEESAKFWPVYNAYEEKHFEIKRTKMRSAIKKIEDTGMDKISDKDALVYLDQLEAADEELFMLRKKLVNDLKPVLKPIKILKLKKAEEDFNKKLLHKYKANKKD